MTNRMDGKEPPTPLDDRHPKVPSKVWKKKYKCKKNKGDHTFVVAHIKYANWYQEKDGTWIKPPRNTWAWFVGPDSELPYWVEWHCSACGKHDYEYRKLNKKFDKFR